MPQNEFAAVYEGFIDGILYTPLRHGSLYRQLRFYWEFDAAGLSFLAIN